MLGFGLQMDCFCQNGVDTVVGSCTPDGAAANERFDCPLEHVFQVIAAPAPGQNLTPDLRPSTGSRCLGHPSRAH